MPPGYIIKRVADESSLIIAADSGFDAAILYNIEPDYVVGDMDSVTRKEELEALDSERIRTYPREKDETDTEIALSVALECGSDYITLAGGGGGRIDHLLGILSLFDREKYPDEWYTGKERIVVVSESTELESMEGRRVSFFPVGGEPCTMVSEGLAWPLDGLLWKKGDAGISNIITAGRMKVTMKTGRLIMVLDIEREAF